MAIDKNYLEKVERLAMKVDVASCTEEERFLLEEIKVNLQQLDLVKSATIDMIPVVSSNIVSIGYDKIKSIFKVQFKNGGIYSYLGVPEEIYTAMTTSNSVGKYYSANIRNTYTCIKNN